MRRSPPMTRLLALVVCLLGLQSAALTGEGALAQTHGQPHAASPAVPPAPLPVPPAATTPAPAAAGHSAAPPPTAPQPTPAAPQAAPSQPSAATVQAHQPAQANQPAAPAPVPPATAPVTQPAPAPVVPQSSPGTPAATTVQPDAAPPPTNPPADANQPAAPAPAAPGLEAPGATAPDAATPAPEQKVAGPSVEELVKPVNALSGAIDAAEKNLEQSPGSQRDLATLRTGIEKIESKAKSAADALQPRLKEVRSQIDKLGAPPGPNDPPEAPDVAAERQRLNGVAAQIDGAIKKAALIEERARQLIGRVQNARKGIFTRFLLNQTDTPLQLRVWQQAGDQLHIARRQLGFILSNWWSAATLNPLALIGVLGAALFGFFGLRFLMRRLIHMRLDRAGTSSPSRAERAFNAAWTAPAYALPATIALIVLYVGLDELGLFYWQVARFAQAAVFPLAVLIGVTAFSHALLQPRRPRWRLFNISDASALRVHLAVKVIAVVYTLDYLIRYLVSILSLPLSTTIIAAFIASLFYMAMLLLIVRTPLGPPSNAPNAPVERWRPMWLKASLIALAVVLVSAASLGYVSLGRFIATQILTTGTGILLVGVLHIAIRWLIPGPGANTESETRGMSALIEQRLKLDDFGRNQLARIQRGMLNALLFAVAIPLLLLSWGVSSAEIISGARAAVFGFDAGGVHISLARIMAAIALFVAVLAATRFVQRWLAAGALAQGRLEAGLANSIYTGAGYIGFAIATLAAISYAGFDITSLAIVAGALSVGIGFGLQSIVNNFVSGLILLVERPIKVGDWVSLKEGQGYVRRIAVRATEIETFDRASLIVPNSELITQTVVNLTHRNLLGRLTISVRISYLADPDHVIRVLQQVVEKSTLILRHPPPSVVLDNLGENAMDFSVRVFLADVNRSLASQTELRASIVKALREEGINIPFAGSLAGHAAIDTPAGRAAIEVGVSHDSDPEQVLEALHEAATRNGLATEAAVDDIHVAFEDINDNALVFSLSVPVAEGVRAGDTRTALRAQAVKALRERGIALASPQRQVRLRDVEDLRAFLAKRAGERTEQRRAGASDVEAGASEDGPDDGGSGKT